jgi:hypothetical protein
MDTCHRSRVCESEMDGANGGHEYRGLESIYIPLAGEPCVIPPLSLSLHHRPESIVTPASHRPEYLAASAPVTTRNPLISDGPLVNALITDGTSNT